MGVEAKVVREAVRVGRLLRALEGILQRLVFLAAQPPPVEVPLCAQPQAEVIARAPAAKRVGV